MHQNQMGKIIAHEGLRSEQFFSKRVKTMSKKLNFYRPF